MSNVVSVNVGRTREVDWNGRRFTTAIEKQPAAGRVVVRGINFEGDDQADRTVHGGRSKAVYAYGLDDYTWWHERHGIHTEAGCFGENLTLSGVDLSGALIGEIWKIGTAVLEVSEPRIPCYKLGYRMNDPKFPREFAAALRPGSYFRIVEEGDVGAGDTAELLERPDGHDMTVREVMRIRLFAHEERHRLAGVAALSLAYRGWAMLEPDQLG